MIYREQQANHYHLRKRMLTPQATSFMSKIEIQDTSLDRSLKVSKSSRMLLCLFVTSSKYRASIGW
ncbi:hypothetical protein CKAN_02292300 [Cinnamomum micranthum f. kanehirae]|uniref:Uncharacterized protein n=1 Tax=Cinnamomum micranthum f. kanehirae TaxID=337451 RepID=A0A3S3NEU7_9MAGN|nr:hypothetical protein CKAN_02292300 [Cinnamomum micranthum f. kanehirae]